MLPRSGRARPAPRLPSRPLCVFHACSARALLLNAWILVSGLNFLPLVRPRRSEICAIPRDLLDATAVAADGEDLNAAGARGGEREMPPVGRVGRALVGPFAERELPGRASRQVVDFDVVPASRTRGKR